MHPDAAGSAVARRIAACLGGAEIVTSPKPEGRVPGGSFPAKDALFVTPHRGRFLKPCPGTSGYTCCGYRVLNLVTGCPLDCTYCILQLYLNQPCIVVHSDWEECLREIDALIARQPGRPLRLGTGELADSLALEPLTGMAGELVTEILRRPEAVLELKTKTTFVGSLLSLDPRGRVIVSWSLNAPEVAESEEHGAPGLEERLAAAASVRQAGFRVGFHFDPLVRFPSWQAGYRRSVEALYDHVPPGDIAWISLGALRYPAALDRVIRERFPGSPLPLGELVPGLDGKLRYFRPLRVELFRFVHREIRRRDLRTPVYLCMESPEVWRASLGDAPPSAAALSRLLDRAAFSCR